jgi:hypothetical protein
MTDSVNSANADSERVQGRDDGGPQHKHDCDTCVFLGRDGVYDLYFHEGSRPLMTTLIARDGPDGEYCSGLAFSVPYKMVGGGVHPPFPELAEARSRAIAAGFGPAIAKAEGRTP